MFQTTLRESERQRPAEQLQPAEPIAAGQNERATSRPAAKARGMVKGNTERLRPHLADGFTRLFDHSLRQATERKQRHMQSLRCGQATTERMGRLQYPGHLMNAPRGLGVGKDREKQLATLACTKACHH